MEQHPWIIWLGWYSLRNMMMKNDNFMLSLKISMNNDNLVNIGQYYRDINAITSRQCDYTLLWIAFVK